MDSHFEVIDLKSGNVIGGYAGETEALASLRRAFQTHSSRGIEDLSLMRITDDDQILVATQADLERLVRDSDV